MNTKYSIAVCLIILLNLMPYCCHAAEPTGDGTSLYLGMPIESVETIWGQPAGNDSYTGTLRWYVKDGHIALLTNPNLQRYKSDEETQDYPYFILDSNRPILWIYLHYQQYCCKKDGASSAGM